MSRNLKKIIVVFCITIGLIGIAGLLSHGTEDSTETVEVVSEKILIPGGQSVGIRMNVKGVLVVGLEEIETEDSIVSPGYEAGIEIGDMILTVNGKEVCDAADMAEAVENSQGQLSIKAARKDEIMDFNVMPVTEYGSGLRKIGIWVKEKIAGIGTLSFYDPENKVYAALGHGIYESKTDTLLPSGGGKLLRTEVKSIKEGEAGKPGEIRGIFYESELPLGEVKKNCEFGIYSLANKESEPDYSNAMVMARQEQIKTGPAYILTTINGDRAERFRIEITKINRQKDAGGKGLEIEVKDERLLAYCGGIVQGMSGSPIIQNNRLVGVVTHVFVNNPTKGYGIFAEWMVEEAGNLEG